MPGGVGGAVDVGGGGPGGVALLEKEALGEMLAEAPWVREGVGEALTVLLLDCVVEGVGLAVPVPLEVGVGEEEGLGVKDGVRVKVGVTVGVCDGVRRSDSVCVRVAVTVALCVAVKDGVRVADAVLLGVAVCVGVPVLVSDGVTVAVLL